MTWKEILVFIQILSVLFCFQLNTDKTGFDSRALDKRREVSLSQCPWRIWTQIRNDRWNVLDIPPQVKIIAATAIQRKMLFCFCTRTIRPGFRKRSLHSCQHWQHQDGYCVLPKAQLDKERLKKLPWWSSSHSLMKCHSGEKNSSWSNLFWK
jgi:hypothetical protein